MLHNGESSKERNHLHKLTKKLTKQSVNRSWRLNHVKVDAVISLLKTNKRAHVWTVIICFGVCGMCFVTDSWKQASHNPPYSMHGWSCAKVMQHGRQSRTFLGFYCCVFHFYRDKNSQDCNFVHDSGIKTIWLFTYLWYLYPALYIA